MALNCADSLATMVRFFDGLALDKLDTLGDVYSPGIEFQDPLHHTRGIAALRQVFEQLFQQLSDISIQVLDTHGDENTGFLLWKMSYNFRGRPQEITGTSHLKFAPDGRVAVQYDFWDASFPVYAQFPLVGLAMRGIRKMIGTREKPQVS
jgi:steroid delta-isomerase